MRAWVLLSIGLILLFRTPMAPAAAASTQPDLPSTLAEVKKECLETARKAVGQVAKCRASGLVGFDVELEYKQRLFEAEQECLDPAERRASLERALQFYEESEKLCEKQIASGAGGQRELLIVRYARAKTEMLLAQAAAKAAATQPAEPATRTLNRKLAEIAEEGYTWALKPREGDYAPEVLAWSRRLMDAQLALADDDAARRRVLADALARARDIEKTATLRFESRVSAQWDSLLAKAYRLEVEARLARAEGRSDDAGRLLQERIQVLTEAVKLSEEAARKQGIPETAALPLIQSWHFEAEADRLRAGQITGLTESGSERGSRTTDLKKLLQQRVAQLRAREALMETKYQAGLISEREVLAARYDRLRAQIALQEHRPS